VNLLRPFLLAVLCGSLASAAGAEDAEAIFDDAARYTVRLDVTIRTPFVEDQQGAHKGAGFVVDRKRKWVMTNAHVAGYSPSTISATFIDGTEMGVRKVYVDPYVDVAIVELTGELPFDEEAELACDDDAGTGHPVGAYGHPWSFNFTGTRGAISGRTTRLGAEFLQTDTPINRGNSGGPLISMTSGRVVGISSATYNNNEDQNTNFAVPIEQACKILALLQKERDPSPPSLAIDFFRLSGDTEGLIVARTFLPDERLPLQVDDEILTANGTPVSTESELMHELRGSLDAVSLTVLRGSEVVELEGSLDPHPAVVDRLGLYFSGMLFASGGYRDSRAIVTGHDIMVHSVAPGSAANGEGLWTYDLVSRIDNVRVQSLAHLQELLSKRPFSGKVQVDFMRVIEDSDSGHFYYSLQRNIDWSKPELLGRWNLPAGEVAGDHPLGAFYRIASKLYQTLTVTPSTARGSTTDR
jgi:serine protease Do